MRTFVILLVGLIASVAKDASASSYACEIVATQTEGASSVVDGYLAHSNDRLVQICRLDVNGREPAVTKYFGLGAVRVDHGVCVYDVEELRISKAGAGSPVLISAGQPLVPRMVTQTSTCPTRQSTEYVDTYDVPPREFASVMGAFNRIRSSPAAFDAAAKVKSVPTKSAIVAALRVQLFDKTSINRRVARVMRKGGFWLWRRFEIQVPNGSGRGEIFTLDFTARGLTDFELSDVSELVN